MSPCVFIDGIDRMIDAGGQSAVKDLIRGLQEIWSGVGDAVRWTIVVSTREENLQDVHRWLDLRAFDNVTSLAIPELSLDEVRLVADREARLGPLLEDWRLHPVVKNAF